jgi:hypothetical protein
MNAKILISTLIPEKTEAREFFEKFKDVFKKHPYLSPQFANTYEPVKYQISEIEELFKFWTSSWSVLWKTKKPYRTDGHFIHTNVFGDAALIIRAPHYKDKIAWFSVFQDIIASLDFRYGYLHLPTNEEWYYFHNLGQVQHCMDFQLAAFTKTTQDGFHNLGWASYFGNEYLPRINLPLLKSMVPFFEQNEKGIIFSLTNDINDVATNFLEYNKHREHVKTAFDEKMFKMKG